MINIEKFAGLVTNASPYAIPPGAAVTQVNVQCISPGQLTVRPGMQAYTLSSTVSATLPVVASFSFQHAGGSVIVYQDAVGNIFSGKATQSDGTPSLTGVPSAPRNITATASSASAVVSWDAPTFNGGGDITGYTVQSSIDGGTVWNYAVSSTSQSATLTGLTNGVSYVFRAAATNNYGISAYSSATSSVTPIGAPDSPTSFQVSAANSGASLTWVAPSNNGGSAITDYVVEYSGNAGQAWSVFADGTSTATSAIITGLSNGQPYVFRVAARNAAGTSAYATYMTPVYPVGVPDQVASLTATYGNAQVRLQWQAPAANNPGGIVDYTIQRSTDSGATWTTLTDGENTDTAYTVTGLTNGTAYQFRVSASNATGAGPYSLSTGNVIPRTPAGAPTALTATPGNREIALSWTAPANNGGAAITDYQIQVSANGGAYSTISKNASTTTSYTATSLTNGTAYVYRVSAVNSEGAGAYVQSSSATPQTVPLAPTNVLTTPNNAYVTVRWTAPSDSGGSVITDYIVQYSADGGSSWTTFADGTSTTLQTNVTGLTNGQAYVFRIAAVSAVGTGNYSTVSASTTPVGPPGAPTAPLVTGGNTQMFANWTAPASDGGSAITGYVIQYRRTSVSTYTTYGTVGNVAEYTISGLTNGFSYYFRVAAVNAVGTGSYSVDSASVTVGQVPAAVATPTTSNPYANSLTDTTLTLSWTAPNSYGSRITDYLIQYSTNSSGPWTLYSDGVGTATTATLTGIPPARDYYYRVSAVSTVGAGPYSTVPATRRIAYGPATPSVTATVSAGYVTLTWPALSDGGAPISGYSVYLLAYNSGTGTYVGNPVTDKIFNSTADLAARTITVPGCIGYSTAPVKYNVQLSNFVDTSMYSASNAVTPTDGPAGTHTVVPEFVDGNCVLNVTLPDRGGCTFSQMLCDYSTDSGSTWTAIPARSLDTLTAYPTTPTGVAWDRYAGTGQIKHWISPAPTSPFRIRSRLGDSSGSPVSGTSYVSTSDISVEYADSRWNRVLFLWDGNVRQSWELLANGTRRVSAVYGSASASTGRFGTLADATFAPPNSLVGEANAPPASFPDNNLLCSVSGNCVEWWMKVPNAGDGSQYDFSNPVLSIPISSDNLVLLQVWFTNTGSAQIKLLRRNFTNSTYSLGTMDTISTLNGQMVHCAYEGKATDGSLYINGTFQPSTSGAFSAPYVSGSPYAFPVIHPLIESVRITSGQRYCGKFQAPSAQFWHPT